MDYNIALNIPIRLGDKVLIIQWDSIIRDRVLVVDKIKDGRYYLNSNDPKVLNRFNKSHKSLLSLDGLFSKEGGENEENR